LIVSSRLKDAAFATWVNRLQFVEQTLHIGRPSCASQSMLVLDELDVSIPFSKKGLNLAFLINSSCEAWENSITEPVYLVQNPYISVPKSFSYAIMDKS
jgi:hypothetical protein